MDCQFCKILTEDKNKIIKERDFTFVVLSDPKLMPGHLLVIPKRHIEKPSELTKEEREELFDEVISLQEKILETVADGCDISEHYRPFIPDNKLKVTHLHFHLRPRELDDNLYMKVQIFENDIFSAVNEQDIDKYKKLLG